MSPYARWRYPRIVNSQIPNKTSSVSTSTVQKENDLIGGLRNALERGESIEKSKKSFLAAGYKSEEVESAVQKISQMQILPSKNPVKKLETNTPTKKSFLKKNSKASSPTYQKQPKQVSKTTIILMVIIAVIIIAGAAVLGIYWNKWF